MRPAAGLVQRGLLEPSGRALVRPTADELEAQAAEASDNAQARRLRSQASAVRGIEEAEMVVEALELLERAVGQVSRRALPAFADRVGRLYARALLRLDRETRIAVRNVVRRYRAEAGPEKA